MSTMTLALPIPGSQPPSRQAQGSFIRWLLWPSPQRWQEAQTGSKWLWSQGLQGGPSPGHPPKSNKPSSRCPGQGQPMLTWLPAATHTEGSREAGVKGLAQSVDTSPLPLSCSRTCSGGLSGPFGFSLCDSFSLSASPSLSCPGRLSSRTAALSTPLQSLPPGGGVRRAWRPGCHDISLGGGLCCPGPSAERWLPRGRQGKGSLLLCWASLGPGYDHSSGLRCLLSFAVTPPAPSAQAGFAESWPLPPSARPVFSSINGCLSL